MARVPRIVNVKEKPDELSKWKDEFYVQVYQLARAGMSDAQIAKALEITWKTFCRWKVRKPAFAKSLELARTGKDGQSYEDYVYDRLSPHLKDLWKKIRRFQTEKNTIARTEALFEGQGVRARQHLFVHAMIHSSFNQSEACRMVNISKATLDRWIRTDPDFGELIEELSWHLGNFFQEGLVVLCQQAHPGAILFANKTFNAKRGFGTVMEVKGKVEHDHKHVHAHVKIDDLNLPLETRQQIMKAMEQKALPEQSEDGEVLDGQFTPVNGEVDD